MIRICFKPLEGASLYAAYIGGFLLRAHIKLILVKSDICIHSTYTRFLVLKYKLIEKIYFIQISVSLHKLSIHSIKI